MKLRSIIYEYIFSFSFIFIQLIGTMLKINTQTDASFHLSLKKAIVVLLVSAVTAYPIASLCGKFLNRLNTKQEPVELQNKDTKSAMKLWLHIWIGISVMWIPYLFAYYPGIFAYDIPWQWPQWFRASYNTHHPIIHTLLMGWTIDVGKTIFGDYYKGIAFHCLSQLLVLSAAVSYGVYYITRLTTSKKIFWCTAIYFAFLPIWPVLGISTTKDIYFSVFYVISFLLLLDCCVVGITKKRFTLTAAALTLAMLFRNNAVYGLVLSCIALAAFMFNKKLPRKIYLCFIAMFLLSTVFSEALSDGLTKATKASAGSKCEMMSIPCQQIARVYAQRGGELTNAEKAEIFKYIPEDRIGRYMWQLADPMKGNFNIGAAASDKYTFVKTWVRFGIKYPIEYIEATLCNTLPLWYVWDESLITVKHCYMEIYRSIKIPTGGEISRYSKLPKLEKLLSTAFLKGYILQVPILSLLFAPALYLWIIIAVSFLLMKYKRYEYLVLPAFLLGYAATLMAGPCILPRYCMNFIACVPILMACIYALLQKNDFSGSTSNKEDADTLV